LKESHVAFSGWSGERANVTELIPWSAPGQVACGELKLCIAD
jgi:hypothetical protein